MKKIIPVFTILLFLSMTTLSQSSQFSGHKLYTSPTSKVFAVTSGDIDNDSKADIVFTEPDGTHLQWMKNEGDGTFSLHLAAEFPAIGTKIVDFDGDNDMDILACSYDLNQVVLLENDGAQNFTIRILSNMITHPLTIATGDIDGDGDLDIAVATQDAGTGVILMINNGNYVFTLQQMSTLSRNSTWVEIIDLDQDGDPDILSNHFAGGGGILWYEQTAPLTFTEHLISYPLAHGVAAGDLDGDGDIDLAAAACGANVAWFENDGSNQFTQHNLISAFSCAVSVGFTDINNDSLTDIVAVAYGASKILWCENNGNGTFTTHIVCDTLLQPSDLCIADINSDGDQDILTGSYSKKLAWFENNQSAVGIPIIRQTPVIIKKNSEKGEFSLFLEIPDDHTATMQLYNLSGSLLCTREMVNRQMPVTLVNIPSGLYLLNVVIGDTRYVHKLLMP